MEEDIKRLEGIKNELISERDNRIEFENLKDESIIKIYNSQIQAIDNVLKELEELRKYDIRKIELKNGGIEKAPNFTKREIELMNLGIALNETTEKSELETYKKIAEKLADTLTFLPINENFDIFDKKEDVLDWARKEVESDGNK